MNDLEQIAKANARATLPELARLRGEGFHCVVEYQGVNAVDVHAFQTADEALACVTRISSEYGASARYHAPTTVAEATDPLAKDDQISDSLAQQAAAAGLKGFEFVTGEEPPYPARLATRPVQIVALVIVDGQNVSAVPPHRSMAVVDAENPGQIMALCGPDTDISSARDAAVFAQAFNLRSALRSALRALVDTFDPNCASNEVAHARAVLDAATPQFVKFDRPSAESQLDAAREGYDPAQNPDTSVILDPTFDADTVDARPSSTN